MERNCDVLIVGAGIAGSTCASILDNFDYNVVLIEESDKLSQSQSKKIDFAEDKNLSHYIKKYELPIAKKTNVSKWYSPNGEAFEFDSDICDLWVYRGDENAYESKLLKNTNTKLYLGHTLKKIGSEYIKIKNPSKKIMEIKPKKTIIANGSFSPYFSSDKEQKVRENYYAHGFVINTLNIPKDIPHIIFDKKQFKNSYLFMVYDSSEETGYLAYGSESKEAFTIDQLKQNKIIKGALENSEILKEIRGLIYVAQPSTLCENNVLFLGDAGNLMDPLFSYGVGNAIKSGVFAAEAIINQKDINSEYQKACEKYILPELHRNYRLRKLFDSLDNIDIDTLINLLNSISLRFDINSIIDNPLKSTILLLPYILKDRNNRKLIKKSIRCSL